ncbi:MAG TPA: hypothetical protein VFN67_02300, partial [Polyangiales bacterium]|nr:hypothetical protein [Polyangiales bacterium]
MTVLFTDSGAGANQNPLAGNYTTIVNLSPLQRNSNQFAASITGTDNGAYVSSLGTISNDQYCQARVAVVGDGDGGVLVRADTGTTVGMFLTNYNAANIYAYSMTGLGSFNEEANPAGSYAVNDDIYLGVVGTTYTIKKNGTTLTTFSDATFAGGKCGFFIFGSVRFINLEIGDFNSGSNIAPSGIASPSALGTHLVSVGKQVSPTGIASARALGTHAVQKEVASAGVASARTTGSPAIQDVALNVAPTGITSPAALGSHTIADVILTLAPTGIASARVTGSPVIANATPQSIAPTGVASARQTGSHAIQDVALNVAPAGVASPSALGAHVIATNSTKNISPTGVDSP